MKQKVPIFNKTAFISRLNNIQLVIMF